MSSSCTTWSPLGLGCHRSGHSATRLLDGRVLLVGGRKRTLAEPGHVCSIDEPRSLSNVEIVDPENGTSRPAAALNEPREGHSAVRLGDGSVVIAGGIGDYG